MKSRKQLTIQITSTTLIVAWLVSILVTAVVAGAIGWHFGSQHGRMTAEAFHDAMG